MGIGANHYLLLITDQLLNGLWVWLEMCSEIPFASIQYRPTLIGVFVYELGLFMLIQARGLPARYLAILFISALFFVSKDSLEQDQMRVTALDVGQGLAVVVETKNHVLIYDAGPKFPSGFNTGDAVILPYLNARNRRLVDILMVSHNDNDHAGGVDALLKQGIVNKLLVSNEKGRYQSAVTDYCRSGDKWQWDGIWFYIPAPAA